MKKLRLTMTGTEPLLMHNSRLSNPLDPATKNLKRMTSKRVKTDEDLEELARLEFLGSLYFEDGIGPYLPGDNIWKSLYEAAKRSKQGPSVKDGVVVETDVNLLGYDGPRDLEGLWADMSFRKIASCRVNAQRVTRCRPIFHKWMVEATIVAEPNSINIQSLAEIAETAGLMVGVGDWRPRFGRYRTEIEPL